MLTEASWAGLRSYIAESPAAERHDLRDLVDVLSGLGCRIGELLALDWIRVDDEAGTIACGPVCTRMRSGTSSPPDSK